MRHRTLDEMVSYFNQQVSEMDIDQSYKIQLLGMVSAIVYGVQKPQWIPCSERLPEYGTAVLTCDDYGEFEINHIIDEDDGEWFWNDVIAWMPLPKPWRGERP